MGLDMYLSANYYLWAHKDDEQALAEQISKIIGEDLPPVPENHFRKTRIEGLNLEVMYWRKANAIHHWFVENVQQGDDDCGRYYVPFEKLEELLKLCEQVLTVYEDEDMPKHKKAQELNTLLPTQAGFFFGSTEFDEWYIADIKNTINGLKMFLDSPVAQRCDYYYHSSW